MKNINQSLSSIVSPFDDDNQEQSELSEIGYIESQKNQILAAIPLKASQRIFSLYFEDLLVELGKDKDKFIIDCFGRLVQTYSLNVVYDKVLRENYMVDKIDMVISCIEYICRDEWLDTLIPNMPLISLETIVDKERLYDFLNENVDSIRIKIIKAEQINELIRFEIEYASNEECVNLLFKLIQKDIPGVVSLQLVTNNK